MDINNFIIIIIMITFTVWIWVKSLNLCPKSFHSEYLILTKKYNTLIKEKNKYKKMIKNQDSTSDDNYQIDEYTDMNNFNQKTNNVPDEFSIISNRLNNSSNPGKFATF